MKNKIIPLLLPFLVLGLTGIIEAAEQSDSVLPQEIEKTLVKGEFPEGTLGPVTLKSTIQKIKALPITLEGALKLAEGENVTIQIEKENVQQQTLDYAYRLSDLLPDIALEYRQSRFLGAAQIFGGENLEIIRSTYQPIMTANYSIYTAGKNIWEIKASEQRKEAQKNLLEDTHQSILSQVALSYYDLQQAYWQRAITLQSIKEAEAQVTLNEARFKEGVGVKLDLLQAQTYLLARKQELLQAERTISQASLRLSKLLNMDFEIDIVPSELESSPILIAPQDLEFSTLLTIAKTHFPQLKALEQLKHAAASDVKVAITDLFPKLDLTAYISGTGPQPDALGLTRFAGFQVSTNLLENLGIGKPIKIKEAKSSARLAELSIVQAEKLIEEQLANQVITIKTLEDQIRLNKESLKYAKEAYHQALGRLKEGVGTNVDLENAMTRLTQARSDLATTFLNYNKAQVSLLAQLGVVSVYTLTQGYQPHAPKSLKS